MESKAATSRLPKMSANLMNCSITALGNSGVGADWPASTEGSTSVRTIRARRCMRSPKMLAQRKLSRRAARCAPAAVSLPQQALGGWLTIALIERITLKLRATRPPAQGLLDEVAGETATGPTP